MTVNVKTLKTTVVNIKELISSSSKSYCTASTNELPAVDIPASRIAILNAIPFMFKSESTAKMIIGDKTNLNIDTAIESEK